MILGHKNKLAKLQVMYKKQLQRGFIPCMRYLNVFDFGICRLCVYEALEMRRRLEDIKPLYFIFGKKVNSERPKIFILDSRLASCISEYEYSVGIKNFSILSFNSLEGEVKVSESSQSELNSSLSFPSRDRILQGLAHPAYSEFIGESEFEDILVVKNTSVVQVAPVHIIPSEMEEFKELGTVPFELYKEIFDLGGKENGQKKEV